MNWLHSLLPSRGTWCLVNRPWRGHQVQVFFHLVPMWPAKGWWPRPTLPVFWWCHFLNWELRVIQPTGKVCRTGRKHGEMK